jgi:hypothetical protein
MTRTMFVVRRWPGGTVGATRIGILDLFKVGIDSEDIPFIVEISLV